MQGISDLKARILKGQTPDYIANVYKTTESRVRYLMRSIQFINPSIHNLDIMSNLPHGKHYDLTEEEIMEGYTPPSISELSGDELEILNQLTKTK